MIKKMKSISSRVIMIFIMSAILLSVLIILRRGEMKSLEADAYNVRSLPMDSIVQNTDDKTRKLMIVAHPDDEVLWGGGHLMSGDYLVVCVTDGRNKVRAKEFADVVNASGNKFIMMEYPDKVGGVRDNWSKVENKISADIEKIMTYKKWDQIVTHNLNGEYGHIHHKSLHAIVTEIYDRDNIQSDLYTFGKYYRKAVINPKKDHLVEITEEQYQFKKKLADMYVSQKNVVKNLWHMSRYEMWTKYEPYSEHPYMKKSKNIPSVMKEKINEA